MVCIEEEGVKRMKEKNREKSYNVETLLWCFISVCIGCHCDYASKGSHWNKAFIFAQIIC